METKDRDHDIFRNIFLLKFTAANILVKNILPFWMTRMVDNERGGFYGRIDGHNVLHADAEKGAILNARILWTFSATCRVLQKYNLQHDKLQKYFDMAQRARTYIIDHFIDKTNGGVYWSLDCEGNPTDTKKQTYAIAFTIYGLAEYARALRATGNKSLHPEYDETIKLALRLADDIEAHAFDAAGNGYVEALSADWQPIGDMRLSDRDENGSRTMNTHLHVLEAYTNLVRALPKELLHSHHIFYTERVENLINIFTQKIMNPDGGHLDLFFNDQWEGKRNIQSYGHDIEAAWLIHEAALVLGEVAGKKIDIDSTVIKIGRASEKGLSNVVKILKYEKHLDSGAEDKSLQWWVQCENVIGHLDLFQYYGEYDDSFVAYRCLYEIQSSFIDEKEGEFYWSLNADYTVNREDDKAGFWKCPYHNSRMCLEIIERDIPVPAKYAGMIDQLLRNIFKPKN